MTTFLETDPYTAPPDAPTVVLVDVDGTVALRGERSPYDWGSVHLDTPNRPVIEVVRALHASGRRIVYVSGRSEECRDATAEWLTEYVGVPFDALYMRPAGDCRPDTEVKLEIFNNSIRLIYNVLCVVDDRASVVAMWRSLGLTVLAVAEGNF